MLDQPIALPIATKSTFLAHIFHIPKTTQSPSSWVNPKFPVLNLFGANPVKNKYQQKLALNLKFKFPGTDFFGSKLSFTFGLILILTREQNMVWETLR